MPSPRPSQVSLPNMTYDFRIVATNSAGTTDGANQSFTTLGPPIVATNAATGVTDTTATLNGSVTPDGLATTYYFQYGTTTSYGTQVPATPASAGSGIERDCRVGEPHWSHA